MKSYSKIPYDIKSCDEHEYIIGETGTAEQDIFVALALGRRSSRAINPNVEGCEEDVDMWKKEP